ncbi:MAG: bifunctional riboflavin kinase/FAD synthetase [Bacteroidetes bacterium]|nr:bifunctional riboflavin kinase/FAD synthetase [Bacteroidota bacterium]
MIIYRSLKEVQYDKRSVVSIGMFDGVHTAHAAVLRRVTEKARAIGGRSVIVTFDPHPREVVSQGKHSVDVLCTLEEKLQLLERSGIDAVFIIPFTFEFSRLSFKDFYAEYIINGIGVADVVEGFNHQFGRDREGGMNQVVELGKQHNFSVEAMAMIGNEQTVISSSAIREAVLNGRIAQANVMLGYEYSFTGVVVRGFGRGKQLGYPTANIRLLEPKKLVPQVGIYAVRILVRGTWYGGMMSIGHNPTFGDAQERTIEVNIFSFDMDIYDDIVTVRCIERTRSEKKFASVDELIAEMGNDKRMIKTIIEQHTQLSS